MMENPAIRKKSLAEELAARLQEQIAAGTFGIGYSPTWGSSGYVREPGHSS